jgi:hypothetical protein
MKFIGKFGIRINQVLSLNALKAISLYWNNAHLGKKMNNEVPLIFQFNGHLTCHLCRKSTIHSIEQYRLFSLAQCLECKYSFVYVHCAQLLVKDE